MRDFMRVDAPVDYPSMCICGSQKGPLVATGFTYRTGGSIGGENAGHVYLCRLCVTRAARTMGLIKGPENERLENAADELDAAEKLNAEKDEVIRGLTEKLAARDQKVKVQDEFIEQLQGEKTQWRHIRDLAQSTLAEV